MAKSLVPEKAVAVPRMGEQKSTLQSDCLRSRFRARLRNGPGVVRTGVLDILPAARHDRAALPNFPARDKGQQ